MTAPKALEALSWAQNTLEDFYGARTCLDVRDFVRTLPGFTELGRLHVEQDLDRGDIDLALLLDRDIFAAWESTRPNPRAASVICEEVSHFVYLGFNHRRQRNISALELELQSEVDRILLAFHPTAPANLVEHRNVLLQELHHKPYSLEKMMNEEARKWAARLLRALSGGQPSAWGPQEQRLLCDFFHKDLAEKIHLLRQLP